MRVIRMAFDIGTCVAQTRHPFITESSERGKVLDVRNSGQ